MLLPLTEKPVPFPKNGKFETQALMDVKNNMSKNDFRF